MTTEDKARLTIDLDAPLCQRLHAVAARRGVSTSDYCRQILETAVASDEPKALSYEEMVALVEKNDAWWKENCGDLVFPDSAPMFRKMRGYPD